MSNVEVQDKHGGAQHPLGEQSSAGSAAGEEGLESAQLYRRSIFDLGSSQLRRIKASLGVSTDSTLAFCLLIPASGCPDVP